MKKHSFVLIAGIVLLWPACHFLWAENIEMVSPSGALPSVVTTENKSDRDAATDFCNYLSRVTQRKIAVSESSADAGAVFHVGRDAFVKEHAPEIDTLFADGYILKAVRFDGRLHVILAGKAPWSSQWAIEQFLKDYCGVRWLFPDPTYGEIVPSRPTLTVDSTLFKKYEPDYMQRANCGMYYYNPAHTLLRNRPKGFGAYGEHALQRIFQQAEFDAHPEWFAYFMDDGKSKSFRGWEDGRPQKRRQWWSYGNGWQICTSHQGTIDHTVKYVLDHFEKNPDSPVVSVGANDGHGWCECDACKALADSFEPAYTTSELWWHWVNQIAKEVAKTYPDKWIEALAYGTPITPPRFELQPNVAITLTIIYADQFETVKGWKPLCKSINLYTYTYGSAFFGFRHYPHAVRDFLKWGHDELGALAHVTECGGDWTLDGPKYHYMQALQWDVNADPDNIMDDFCNDSYGKAAKPMRAFWDRLEQCYENRPLVPYGKDRQTQRLCFYTWVSWQNPDYLRPNTEFEGYTLEDIYALDESIDQAAALAAADTPEVQFRVERMVDAWKYVRTLLWSKVNYFDSPPAIEVNSETQKREALVLAREIAKGRADRQHYLGKMRMVPHINPRMSLKYYWNLGTALTLFSQERTLLDNLCQSITAYTKKTAGTQAAETFWRNIDASDYLRSTAQTQLYVLKQSELTNILANGDFETGNLNGWTVSGNPTVITDETAYQGKRCVSTVKGATLTQTVFVAPQERYRLTAWVKYSVPHKGDAPSVETDITFHEGNVQFTIWSEPARNVLSAGDPADRWRPFSTTVTVPPGATLANVKLKAHVPVLLDNIVLDRIQDTRVDQSIAIKETFDEGQTLDASKWFRPEPSRGTEPPRIDKGWLVYGDEKMYPLTSYATFNDLLKYEGEDRYCLRFHAATLPGTPQNEATVTLGIQAGTGTISTKVTGMFFYHYFRANSAFACYNWQGTTKTYTSTWNLKHLGNGITDVWYMFYFDPKDVSVYASADGYDDSEASLVCRYPHGITELHGENQRPVYLKIGKGSYRLDEISLISPKATATLRSSQETKTPDALQPIIDDTTKKKDEDMNIIETPPGTEW
jgi:hypothetical protein